MTVEKNRRLLFVGVASIICGLVLNEWLLTSFLSSDGVIDSNARISIWLVDAILVAAGLALILLRHRLHFALFRETGRTLQYILIAGIALRVLVYIFLNPENNDPHLEVVEYIVANGTVPTSDKLVLSWHPPLYYLMAAPLAAIGTAKLVQALSLILSVANFALIYSLVRRTNLFKQDWTRVHVLLFTALLPQFVVFGNFISNDALVFLVGTLIFLQIFRYVEQPTRKNVYVLAILCGIGLLTKGSLLAFLPVTLGMLLVVELRKSSTAGQKAVVIGTFCLITTVLGSYKFVENTVNFGKPMLSIEDDTTGVHNWIRRQPKTYQGWESMVDFNLGTLMAHPFLSEHAIHSVPLLLYATFWYSYIPESNFNATRDYPLSVLPRTIYIFGLVPTVLMVTGIANVLWRNRTPLKHFHASTSIFNRHLKESVLVIILVMNFMLVLIWGLKHNAWSFFQGRLLFPSFLALAFSLGWGLERITQWRAVLQPVFILGLYLTYALLLCYFGVEMGALFFSKYLN